MSKNIEWHKVLENPADLPEGRVTTVTAAHQSFCLTHYQGEFGCLTNKCPHQGGPLGEGSIEKGFLRCPWHGWDYHPLTGRPPGGFDDAVDTFPVEIRKDGVYIGVPVEPPHVTTITDVMVETMVNWGVEVGFGMVGHSNLGLADAIRRQEGKGNIRFYGIRHEGAAAFAASAYGKLMGKPAFCFTIAGPGATNLFTGLWDAKVDRAPILALTGQVATQVVGTGNFQELDLVNAFQSVAAFNHRAQKDSKHAELMSLAVKHAILRRDVSHLTFPDEMQTLPAKEGSEAQTPEGRITPQQISPPQEMLDQAIALLQGAKRPIIIAGHGSKFHMPEIIALAEHLNCPVMTTFKGKGQIPDGHPLAGGVLGRSGTPVASWFMNECDVILALGASFSKHTGITHKKTIIQVDFDPLALSKFHKIDCQLWGEISVTVKAMRDGLQGDLQAEDQRGELAERWAIWKKEKAKRLRDDHGHGVSSIAVFEAMNRLAPENAVMCVDVGNNAYSFGRYYESKSNNSFLMSGYLGSIGFAYPAAIGAWAAVGHERPIVAVAGDGGFVQYLGEITTAVKYNMNIKLILLNNSELGKISKEQRAAELEVWKTSLHNPNFAEYATSCGALGIRVTQKGEELDQAMQSVFAHDGPAVLEILTDVGLI
ncbi:MAG: Rieske 2Fe-2S domain-containing protein [Saprospiraceae bacterium]|nr:Rieske 2Fe-2S domain-containing protein [Saprospiraceae bacterium]